MESDNRPSLREPQWKHRRRIIYATLIFCAWCVAYIIFKGLDLRVYETIAIMAFGLAGSTIGFYVAGATWQDVSLEKINKTLSRKTTNKTKSPEEAALGNNEDES